MNDATGQPDYLSLSDEQLLAQCNVHTYRSSGPGGQHRNKVSSAVRLHHRPTGISAHGDDSRSQHDNKRMALTRLRMNLALQLRNPVDPKSFSPDQLPPDVANCIFTPKNPSKKSQESSKTIANATKRLQIGRKDYRFWTIARFLLDLLDGCQGRLSDAAGLLGITTSNLVTMLKQDRHLFGEAQQLRKRHGQGPLK